MRKNAFKEIEGEETLPPQIKEETLGNVGALAFIMDLVDLFVARSGKSLVESLSPGENRPLGLDQSPRPGEAS